MPAPSLLLRLRTALARALSSFAQVSRREPKQVESAAEAARRAAEEATAQTTAALHAQAGVRVRVRVGGS